uniref:Uncharacterized protein n=1 Tax=Aplanochytrium stocchinoi TaxID=215587 RepID=A0A7S3V012_9STRA
MRQQILRLGPRKQLRPRSASKWERVLFRPLREENLDKKYPVSKLQSQTLGTNITVYYRVALNLNSKQGNKIPGIQHGLLPGISIKGLVQDASLVTKTACERYIRQTENSKKNVELSLTFCHDSHIQYLNEQYRGVSKPTDVLSFEINGETETDYPILGELNVIPNISVD